LATVEECGEKVHVVLRAPLARPAGKAILTALLVGALGFCSVAVKTGADWASAIAVVFGFLAVVALLLGLKRTEVWAAPAGIEVEWRWLVWRRRRAWERGEIGDVRKRLDLEIVGVAGQVLGRVMAFNRAEELWLMHLLRRAIGLDHVVGGGRGFDVVVGQRNPDGR
jgi:hypothetical protein